MATITELVAKVEEMISHIQNGLPTQYTTYHDETTETIWKIRVANHKANPERADKHTISLIIPVEAKEANEDDSYSPIRINKKSFSSIPQQYVIVDGCDENGYSIEELLNYNID